MVRVYFLISVEGVPLGVGPLQLPASRTIKRRQRQIIPKVWPAEGGVGGGKCRVVMGCFRVSPPAGGWSSIVGRGSKLLLGSHFARLAALAREEF